jgi:hypothetical protein
MVPPHHHRSTPHEQQILGPEVIADSSGKWCRNGLRFATHEEAEGNVAALAWRWTAVRETRVVETDDPVNSAWEPDKGLIHLNGRGA